MDLIKSSLVVCLLITVWLLSPSHAKAISFNDGGHVDGFFTFDSNVNGLSNWSFAATGGSAISHVYLPVDSTPQITLGSTGTTVSFTGTETGFNLRFLFPIFDTLSSTVFGTQLVTADLTAHTCGGLPLVGPGLILAPCSFEFNPFAPLESGEDFRFIVQPAFFLVTNSGDNMLTFALPESLPDRLPGTVPEPTTLLLFGTTLAGLRWAIRRPRARRRSDP